MVNIKQMPRMLRAFIRTLRATIIRSHRELEAQNTGPEFGPSWNRTAQRVFNRFANGARLNLHVTVRVPIQSKCHGTIALRPQGRRSRTAETFGGAVCSKAYLFEPRRDLDSAKASIEDRLFGFDSAFFLFSGEHPCARDIPATRQFGRQVIQVNSLLLAGFAHVDEFALQRKRTVDPARLGACSLTRPFQPHIWKVVYVRDGVAANGAQAFRDIGASVRSTHLEGTNEFRHRQLS